VQPNQPSRSGEREREKDETRSSNHSPYCKLFVVDIRPLWRGGIPGPLSLPGSSPCCIV